MKAGIYDMPRDAYHADPCDEPSLSASIACVLLRQSPKHAHAKHPRLGGRPQEDRDIFDLGTAAHDYIIEGTEDRYRIAVSVNKDGEQVTDWKTKNAQAERILARAQGKIPLLARQLDPIRQMAHAVRSQLAEFEDDPMPLAFGKPERTLVWREGRIWCRARLDWLHDDNATIDDLKTGEVSAEPDAWTRSLYNRGGELQAAFYLRGLKALTGIEAQFRFIAVENWYPYATSIVALSPMALAVAHERVEQAIRLWERCLTLNNWHGYPTRTAYVDPPAWSMMEAMEDAP